MSQGISVLEIKPGFKRLLQPDTQETQADSSRTTPEFTPVPFCHLNEHIENVIFYINGVFTPPCPLHLRSCLQCCPASPEQAQLLFRLQCTPRGQYFEAGWAGCSVRQEFPVLLPLPPFPLGNSETKSILARGYSLTSIPGVCYSPNDSLLYVGLKALSRFCAVQVWASCATVGGAWMEKGTTGIKQQPLNNRLGSARISTPGRVQHSSSSQHATLRMKRVQARRRHQ